MPSFQIGIRPNRRAAARFIAHVRRTLQQALAEEQLKTGITQSKIAQRIDVHRSVISRELNGQEDITLGRVAELAWALGREISFDLPIAVVVHGDNKTFSSGFVRKIITSTSTSSAKAEYEERVCAHV